MIKMTYSHLINMQFTMAMQKLSSIPLDQNVAYQVKKIGEALIKKRNEIADEYQKEVGEKYGKKDAEGKLVGDELAEGMEEEGAKAREAFGKKEFVIDRFPIPATSLGGTKFSATELTVLDGIIVEQVDTADAAPATIHPIKSGA